MDSPRSVVIVKMFVENSICAYREGKKTDKHVVELATRAQDPIIQALAVEILNEHQEQVKAAHDDPENADWMTELRRLQAEREKQLRDYAESRAQTVSEKPSVEEKNIVTGTRLRKRPERYTDIEWTDNGSRKGKEVSNSKDVDPSNEYVEFWKDLSSGDSDAESTPDDGSDAQSTSDDDYEDVAAISQAGSDVGEEELRDRPLTDKQRAKEEALEAMQKIPDMDDGLRQLSSKLLEDYDITYTVEHLDDHKHLTKALKLIHCRKMGIPYGSVPTVHIKVMGFEKKFW